MFFNFHSGICRRVPLLVDHEKRLSSHRECWDKDGNYLASPEADHATVGYFRSSPASVPPRHTGARQRTAESAHCRALVVFAPPAGDFEQPKRRGLLEMQVPSPHMRRDVVQEKKKKMKSLNVEVLSP